MFRDTFQRMIYNFDIKAQKTHFGLQECLVDIVRQTQQAITEQNKTEQSNIKNHKKISFLIIQCNMQNTERSKREQDFLCVFIGWDSCYT